MATHTVTSHGPSLTGNPGCPGIPGCPLRPLWPGGPGEPGKPGLPGVPGTPAGPTPPAGPRDPGWKKSGSGLPWKQWKTNTRAGKIWNIDR